MYFKYLKYLIKHKWYVYQEARKMGLFWLSIIHDWSKFRPSEFLPYARYFYGNYPKYSEKSDSFKSLYHGLYREDIEHRFDYAWLLHIHRNKHHWQHWILHEDDGPIKLIPIHHKYLREMLADWRGAGMAITGTDNLIEWYAENKNKIQLNRINRKYIEKKMRGLQL